MIVLVRANAMIGKHLVRIAADVSDAQLDAVAADLVAVHVDGHERPEMDDASEELYRRVGGVTRPLQMTTQLSMWAERAQWRGFSMP